MAFDFFYGTYGLEHRFEAKRVPPSFSRPVWVGFEGEARTVYLVPTDSSLRTPMTVTGSRREQAILVDSIVDVWRVPLRAWSLRNAVEIEVCSDLISGSSWYRLSEPRKQGRLGDLVATLRAAWNGWVPPIDEDDDEEGFDDELEFEIDDEELAAAAVDSDEVD